MFFALLKLSIEENAAMSMEIITELEKMNITIPKDIYIMLSKKGYMLEETLRIVSQFIQSKYIFELTNALSLLESLFEAQYKPAYTLAIQTAADAIISTKSVTTLVMEMYFQDFGIELFTLLNKYPKKDIDVKATIEGLLQDPGITKNTELKLKLEEVLNKMESK